MGAESGDMLRRRGAAMGTDKRGAVRRNGGGTARRTNGQNSHLVT